MIDKIDHEDHHGGTVRPDYPHAPTENFRKFNVEEHMARLKEIWGDRVFSADEVREMREAELEGEEG